MLRDLNEELVLFRIKQYATVVKEMKAEFQVEKFRLYNTFKDKEVLKMYTEEQTKNGVLFAWYTKKGIEEMEKQLKSWEEHEKKNKKNSYL
jgi:N6-adenosine-specific RNA methylase IME4